MGTGVGGRKERERGEERENLVNKNEENTYNHGK